MSATRRFALPLLAAALLAAGWLLAQETAVAEHPVLGQVEAPLVRLKDGKLEPVEAKALLGRKYYVVYYSAHWCGPCRRFTPELVKEYQRLKDQHGDELELIFLSADRNAAAMLEYMKAAKMPWVAVDYSAVRTTGLRRYAPRFVPALTVLDAAGKVVVNGRETDVHQGLRQLKKLF